MTDSSMPLTEAHIEALELKMMDLENTVQELNDVILRQYKDIERLQLQQQEVMNRMAGSSSDADSAPSAIDEVPPHY
ncbi:MAG: putative coiled-coil protein SlyX [Granulosicoccus sp.]|jgi:uncharacterized coiled-coil protein SlyX